MTGRWIVRGGGLLVVTLATACVERAELFGIDTDEGRTGGAAGASSTGGTSGAGGAGGTGGNAGPLPDPVVGPLGSFVQVDGGDVHTCAVVDGELYCWGENPAGQLGLGDVSQRLSASRVGTAGDWEQVGAGGQFTCGLRSGGVYCWGSGTSGQLGNGLFTSSLVPVEVSLPSAATSIAVGHEFACAILQDESLHCWGANTEGQLAQNDPFPGPGTDSASPVPVDAGSFRFVAAGQGHACAIATDGALYCWGRNVLGELGLGDGAEGQLRVPQRVGTASDWLSVVAGQNHTCGVRAGGVPYCWGANGFGQLGLGDDQTRTTPTELTSLSSVTEMALDTFHGCAVTTSEQLSCWGRNVEGQLGRPDLMPQSSPARAEPTDVPFLSVSAGRFHTCAVGQDAAGVRFVSCTGQAPLGVGDEQRRATFTPIVTEE